MCWGRPRSDDRSGAKASLARTTDVTPSSTNRNARSARVLDVARTWRSKQPFHRRKQSMPCFYKESCECTVGVVYKHLRQL